MIDMKSAGAGRYIHPFAKGVPAAGPVTLEVLGGKGINLVELTNAGFRVPPGFVVTTAAYKKFVEANRLQERILELAGRAPDDFEEISAQIRELFASGPVPRELAAEVAAAYARLTESGGEAVAVRSSATAEDLPEASFAGQQDTYLNVRGEAAVLDAVRSCWGSLWTARAMSYRAQQNIPSSDVALAVVVQRMVMAEAAGIMFTANPVTGARDEVVVNAAWGLGEAIVGGHVTPDTYVVDKHSGKVRETQISEKTVMTAATEQGTAESEVAADRRHARVLDDGHVTQLAVVGREVEAHYKGHQDIEWCLAKGEFYLVQARPITSLPVDPAEVAAARQAEIAEVRKRAEDRGRVRWAIYNLAETLKSPTPLTWDVIGRWMGGSGGFVGMYLDLGYFPSKRVMTEGMLNLIGGRIYADLERHAELFFDQWPQEYDVEAAPDATALLEGPPTKFNFTRAGGRFLLRLPLYLFKMIRQGRRMKRLARRCLDTFNNEVRPKFEEYVREARARRLDAMSDAELLAELERRETAFNGIVREAEKTSTIAVYFHGRLTGTLTDLLGEERAQDLIGRLTKGLDDDKTFEQSCDLHGVAMGQIPMEKFIAEYGHRAAGEFELAEPRWYEETSYLEQQVASYRRGHSGITVEPHENHANQKRQRLEAEKELTAILAEAGGSSLEEEIRADMAGAQKYLPYRETSKHYYMMAYALIRDAIQVLAGRWGLGGDIYFLRWAELAAFAAHPARRDELLAEIRQRRGRWEALKVLEMPDFIDSDDAEAIGRPVEMSAAGEGVLKGKGVAPGTQSGTARIVNSPKEAGDLGPDYVLVCTSTDPGWTPLFVHARGVVVERGGMLSHGAIVARDFGIPCVVLANATRLLPPGAHIRLDGNRGTVEILGAAAKEGAK